MSYETVLADARRLLADLDDEERVEFMHTLMDGYCEDCGRQVEGICHCENDE